MWTFLGSWLLIALLAGVAGYGLLVATRRRSKVILATVTGAFLVATVALVALLVSPTTVDGSVECGTTIGSTRSEELDPMTTDDLAAAGEENYTMACRTVARQRYGLGVGGYLLFVAAVGVAASTFRKLQA